MVARNQLEIKWKIWIMTTQAIGKLPAALWWDDGVVQSMENRRLHVTADVKGFGPILLAFFHPLPGQGPISV